MSEHDFGGSAYEAWKKRDFTLARNAARRVEPTCDWTTDGRRVWWFGPNLGSPQDDQYAVRVMQAIWRATSGRQGWKPDR